MEGDQRRHSQTNKKKMIKTRFEEEENKEMIKICKSCKGKKYHESFNQITLCDCTEGIEDD